VKPTRASAVQTIRERATRLKVMCDELDRAQGRDTSAYQTLIDRILAEAETFPAVQRGRRPPLVRFSADHQPDRRRR
jgi:hypothetical protein